MREKISGRKEKKYMGKMQRKDVRKMAVVIPGIIMAGIFVCVTVFLVRRATWTSPDELLLEYMKHIPNKEYEDMYEMIDAESSGGIEEEDFITRNSAIYEGIEVSNMKIQIKSWNKRKMTVSYRTSFDTTAGKIRFDNVANFKRGKRGYKLIWGDSLIFPELGSSDKVRVSTTEASRGQILDRNGRILAGKGVALSVGIVPGKVNDRENTIEKVTKLLDIEQEVIEDKLSAQWVKEDSFVPIQTIAKVEQRDLMTAKSDDEIWEQKEVQDKLEEIPGVMLSDVEVREYPLGEAAAHLIGYVQSVTAEDLEEHKGEGYSNDSVIGRSGIERLFEKELKGQNGCRIYIVDSEGNEIKELAEKTVEDGKDIQLTIDADCQNNLYEQFQEDKSASVAMNPYTGEVLALVSTPSYDTNAFIMGLSNEQWTAWNEDEKNPLYNRFCQVWCPGSSFKSITAAIGLESGAINPEEDYGSEGLSWQKDSSWGSYYITTLHTYEPVVLENALIYSDNIYFAKAALKIGAQELEDALGNLGFQEKLPFEIDMAQSKFSDADHIESEIQLADSGYGQGEILVNPLHLASIYTAFCNEGNVIKPYLLYQEKQEGEYWISEAFSKETAQRVLEGLKKVVNDPAGTGYGVHREDMTLAGKTGTAEIKASKDDTSGTELGWFAVLAGIGEEENSEEGEDNNSEKAILIVSMVEDVKERGGSGYVVEKDSQILDKWFDSLHYNN